MNKWKPTKPRISEDIKQQAIEYAKQHSIGAAAKKFKLGYNTINYWVNPAYKKYQDKKSEENIKKIKENSKKYSLKRRKLDPEYVKRRNEDTKKWQKEKRKKDKEWRDARVSDAKTYYEENKNEEFMKETWRKASRNRRARQKQVNENYTREDEKYTKQLFGCKCVVCGTTEDLSIDHWLPLSKGHALTRSNAVTMCRQCNRLKSDKLPDVIYDSGFVKKIEKTLNNKECVSPKSMR